MGFRLTPRSMTLDDLELLQVRIFLEFRAISYIWKATTTKRMEIDPYCQRQNCGPVNVLFIVGISRRFSARGLQTTSHGFVSDSWAFLFTHTLLCITRYILLQNIFCPFVRYIFQVLWKLIATNYGFKALTS